MWAQSRFVGAADGWWKSLERIHHWHAAASEVIHISSRHGQAMELRRGGDHGVLGGDREAIPSDIAGQFAPDDPDLECPRQTNDGGSTLAAPFDQILFPLPFRKAHDAFPDSPP